LKSGKNGGIVLQPSNKDDKLSMILNPEFECGNSVIEMNVAIKSFTDNKDEYIGIMFRYLKIEKIEEY